MVAIAAVAAPDFLMNSRRDSPVFEDLFLLIKYPFSLLLKCSPHHSSTPFRVNSETLWEKAIAA